MKFALPFSLSVALLGTWITSAPAAPSKSSSGGSKFQSHAPTRPLPTPNKHELTKGPKKFVDAARGDDSTSGTVEKPWKTLAYALRQLKPGDTLYLRGGVYYERPHLSRSGTAEAPITIASYPGELAIIDGSLREFADDPAGSWQPANDGVPGEYVSTRTYLGADERIVPRQFLPGSWEPMWGIEDERPLALGHFVDSMQPLHGYRLLLDLRADNEFWIAGKKDKETGLYCGPGMWFNRDTGRIHIRLAHHRLEGLGDYAYRGETDPRKLPLVVAAGFGHDVLRLTGVNHVKLRDIVFRGATGSPMLYVYGCQNVELDHLTVFGGFPGLLVDASQHIKLTHSAFRGLAAPWTSRAHMKYRGTATYMIELHNNMPENEDIEIAWCEFTDDHDFAFFRHVKNLQFHHSLVDNFNDDGFEVGPKLRDHTMYIWQNRIGSILGPFTQHQGPPDESPVDHNPAAGAYIYRNVIDLRTGTYKTPPTASDPSGDYLHTEGHLASDHGGPTWTVMHFYHNTVLRETPTFRDLFLFGLGTQGLRNSERDVFNNIFVQMDKVPGAAFVAMKHAENVREGGNLLWGLKEGPELNRDHFAKFRSSPLFAESQQFYSPGWTTQDRVADPKFVRLAADSGPATDLRLKEKSAAIDFGVPVPKAWPDPLRDQDGDAPDAGALPRGVEAWNVGVDGRLSLFGN